MSHVSERVKGATPGVGGVGGAATGAGAGAVGSSLSPDAVGLWSVFGAVCGTVMVLTARVLCVVATCTRWSGGVILCGTGWGRGGGGLSSLCLGGGGFCLGGGGGGSFFLGLGFCGIGGLTILMSCGLRSERLAALPNRSLLETQASQPRLTTTEPRTQRARMRSARDFCFAML